jgi:5-(carboxyamino)imidazole ribonucleotide synthase
MTKRVGVIGGGQLAWMMALEAQSLDIELFVQTPHPDDPAVEVASGTVFAEIDSVEGTAALASLCDTITFENEFVNLEALAELASEGVVFYPSLQTLAPLLDKYDQRCYLQSIALPVPQFARVNDQAELVALSLPMVLKARRHGYDGQGTFIIRTLEELLSKKGQLEKLSLMSEEYIPFARELAIIAARGISGEIVTYPVVETLQENQVCHRVLVPAAIEPAIEAKIDDIARNLLKNLEVVGVFGIEFFLTADGEVYVNEIAPRTHNSGHYTLNASHTSQFAMQLQAVAGLALGSPDLLSAGAVMVNLLGLEDSHADYESKCARLAAIPGARLHWYGKTASRPGRKLGHVTVLADTCERDSLEELARAIEHLWYGKS